jgi:hypothetical protein
LVRETVKATFLYASQGWYLDANNGLSAQLRAILDQAGMAKQLWDGVTRKGSITKVEILKEEKRGEGATVRFKIHYKDGRSFESEEDLRKEGGNWRIASDHYLMQAAMEPEFPLGNLEDGKDRVSNLIRNQRRRSHSVSSASMPSSASPLTSKSTPCRRPAGVTVVDLEVGKQVTSPTRDRDWGQSRSVAFGNNAIAVVTGGSVKVFSRKSGELEQNVRGSVDAAALTAEGKMLAISVFRPGHGRYVVFATSKRKRRLLRCTSDLLAPPLLPRAGNAWLHTSRNPTR